MDKVSYILGKAIALEVAECTCLPCGHVRHAGPPLASFSIIITTSPCASRKNSACSSNCRRQWHPLYQGVWAVQAVILRGAMSISPVAVW